jgi:2'-5' RNA ligase
MPRLFIAIDLPAVVRQELCRLNVPIAGCRWVPADQLHLTLAFLGDVGEERVAGLARALGQVSAAPFLLHFDRLGCFPTCARPRVLWVGLKPEPLLLSLADRLRELLRAGGIPQEERPFSPHITLARLKLPATRQCRSFLERPLALERTPIPVVEFILFESRLTAAGAIHTPLKRFPLSGGSGGPPA